MITALAETPDTEPNDHSPQEKAMLGGINSLQYGVDDNPPWYTCIALGLQHYVTQFGSTFSVPFILAAPLCMEHDFLGRSQVLGTILFMSGIITVLQTTFGVRLPIIQGASFAFLPPVFAILSQPQWKCPASAQETINITHQNLTAASENGTVVELDREIWYVRIREIQGAIMVSSLLQIGIGFTGVIGTLLRYIGPLTIAPTIVLMVLPLHEAATASASQHWWISLLTVLLICLFSQYLTNVPLPYPSYARGRGWKMGFAHVFKLFPILLAVIIAWIICIILTLTNVFTEDPKGWGYPARTDTNLRVLKAADWIRFPYPGQWGLPTVSVASTIAMMGGVMASIMESIGDYYACARLSGAPPPPKHAVNRGIGMEGIGCLLTGAWGTGNGTTSYSENIGAIGITKVASRRVVQVGGLLMIVFGLFGKFGALFVTIPAPVVGGMFLVMFGMIAATGLANLQFVDLNSSRNLFIIGFSMFAGFAIPQWVAKNTDALTTGVFVIDQMVRVLLTTAMMVGGLAGFFLDNTLPGSDEERGLLKWREELISADDDAKTRISACYDFPIGMNLIRKTKWLRHIPFMPTFTGYNCCRLKCSPCCHETSAVAMATCCRKRKVVDIDITVDNPEENPLNGDQMMAENSV
ncbi:solute carrier family 23 member 1-like [Lineus longissimus]|uniref:solute carrier family 23 member 1-like n=1 Tax=Lineus longissimus TaxID=88925 RepID=UPI002B4EC0CB